jgi:hypothetical protein
MLSMTDILPGEAPLMLGVRQTGSGPVVPILLGRGVRLWDGLEGLEKDYQVEATSSPSGVTHVTFTRTGV